MLIETTIKRRNGSNVLMDWSEPHRPYLFRPENPDIEPPFDTSARGDRHVCNVEHLGDARRFLLIDAFEAADQEARDFVEGGMQVPRELLEPDPAPEKETGGTTEDTAVIALSEETEYEIVENLLATMERLTNDPNRTATKNNKVVLGPDQMNSNEVTAFFDDHVNVNPKSKVQLRRLARGLDLELHEIMPPHRMAQTILNHLLDKHTSLEEGDAANNKEDGGGTKKQTETGAGGGDDTAKTSDGPPAPPPQTKAKKGK